MRFYREKLVGKALGELETKHSIPRSEIFVQTKCIPAPRPALAYQLVLTYLASSLCALSQVLAAQLAGP